MTNARKGLCGSKPRLRGVCEAATKSAVAD